MKRKIRAMIIMLVFGSIVLGVYYKMNNTVLNEKEEVKIPQTTVERLLLKDLEKEYPATVKAVMKLYSEYSKCFYDGEYTEEELDKLVLKYRMLLDEELLAENPKKEQIETLKNEIHAFKEEEKVILSYYWPEESAVTQYTKSGKNYASSIVCYTLKKGSSTVEESRQKFVLREDADGKWKILGWGLINK